MVAELYARIGAEVRRRREGLGLSQAQLADRIGVGRTSITMIERGSQAILVHQLLDIAKTLKVTPDRLLDAANVIEPAGPTTELHKAAEAHMLLSDLEPIGRITR